ncbi:alpha/beta fold hydrolase [Pelodictyon phaeoclathratiforme]|jgi:pimeloyl-ACP methyl ester carboxylesterase|uniref:Alpha/beta hydrolase fold n=1 Tax=Pelodictyon phaeoclathratiforme (strain DSM 5477 / BU-1) TaxID=324925 RepID=B4SG63_PELPB|nr:alpha/beta hydrolase [Pelodictyon phaeoclathratiforme]ACF43374.1 alpha/beta hydrolase fold [Pelodictyon phaeoclathratiforme BU-1]MBV5289316.1 alpha/beta hydrolase [Pelodictyon phaeoclathratiforme]
MPERATLIAKGTYATNGKQTSPEKRFIEVNGFKVHYRMAGSGKPLVVLLHGSFLSLRSWRLVFDELAKTTTVLAFDRPAFGYTSRPLPSKATGVSYTPEAQSDLVIALIKKLGFSKAVLVGNSTGGTLALLTALRHPQHVEGVVLAGAMIYSGYATSEVPAFMKPVMKAMTPVFSRLMKFLITRLYDRNIRGFWHNKERLGDAVLAEFRSDLMHGNWSRAFWELFLETHHLQLEKRLKTMSLPSLVITGEHDLTVKTEESIRLARELPCAELVVVPDCGHLPHEEQPEAFLVAVRKFLKRVV